MENLIDRIKNICSRGKTPVKEYLSDRETLDEMLAEIARKDPYPIPHVEKLDDPELLAEIAINARDGEVRRLAVKNLIYQDVLAEIAQKDTEGYVRREAVAKLTDQHLLTKIAKEDRNLDIKKAAIENFDEEHKRLIPEIVQEVWQNKENYPPEDRRDFIYFAYNISQQEQKEILRKYDGEMIREYMNWSDHHIDEPVEGDFGTGWYSDHHDYYNNHTDISEISIHFPHE
ncbi:MAG: hypothetical protein LBB85_00870 [Dysgonamonadaceae bacterium]|jgi:hypothetical protein|nr:hypothetical protein [Dysgonamonadaceae bacterium]